MENPNKYIVDLWVEEAAGYPIIRFNPTTVSRDTGLDLSLVFERLLELVRDGKLVLEWEIRCPNCFRILLRDSNINHTTVECDECGEIEVITDIIFPILSFNAGYREIIKKKQNLKRLVFSAGRTHRIIQTHL